MRVLVGWLVALVVLFAVGMLLWGWHDDGPDTAIGWALWLALCVVVGYVAQEAGRRSS